MIRHGTPSSTVILKFRNNFVVVNQANFSEFFDVFSQAKTLLAVPIAGALAWLVSYREKRWIFSAKS